MRPLVLAAAFAALAGCSLPYEGTSFRATPKPEHMAEGEERQTNDHVPAGGEASAHEVGLGAETNAETSRAKAVNVYSPDAETSYAGDVFAGMTAPPLGRADAVFPVTVPPSKQRTLEDKGYRDEEGEAAEANAGESSPTR